ncbi:MAG TPA: carboxypeptidase M32 [Flavipsychrobacter sp.]|nr:carboxypeptidase M32 [Flavipsychrobacter sp.]
MQSSNLYEQYKNITQKAADFNNAAAVLGWDQEVYMPKKGFAFRGRQLATLASQAHELVTSDAYGKILHELSSKNDLKEEQQHNVRLSLEDYEKAKKLSTDFVEKLTQQSSESYSAWIEARRQNDFSVYAPQLEKMIALKKQQADLYGYEKHPYDALLDDYEKGATVAMLNPVFKMVKEQLSPLLNQIIRAPQVDDSFFYQTFSKQKQFDLSVEMLKQIGYDFDAGRQDYSEHPFSTSFAPTDVRVTTRVDENNLASLLWSSIHEGGHALYEQGLPEEQYGLPLGAAVSLSIHESQSRLWENSVGRSLLFWKFFYPQLLQYFPEQLGKTSVEEFYKATNKVAPSLIRTEADEITYHFHVMIRYEIEKSLLINEINPKDLAGVWNEYYQKYLGVSSPDDKQGVLQDVHWSHGSFGYFPTYSLGSFYAAQFFEHAMKEVSNLEEQLANGEFKSLLQWLRTKVHQHGRRYNSEELCERITGRGLDFSSFMNYAQQKYSAIYK